MLSIDRKSEIYNKFLQNKTLTIKKMAEELDVSEQTIRRDFKELEKAGIITMFYSGAKLNEKALPTINVDFSVRQKLTLREKEDMAKLIKDVFEEKDSIFLDNSMAGTIAPKIFPKCGVPVACIPVRILDMILFFIFKQN